jgi:1-acyl-sn-glycerol-3-phosphate acyltransferase
MENWKFEPARDLQQTLGERAQSLHRESGLLESVVTSAWWSAVKAYLVGFHRLSVIGKEHLPRTAPFVLVANHTSHLDALVLGSILPARLRHRTFALAAGDTFFSSPGRALFAAFFLNALPLWRRRPVHHALEELRSRLVGDPCGLVVFPEGTRSRDGRLQNFKPGIGALIAGTEVPVIPCALNGTYAALPPGKSIPRPHKISVQIGQALQFSNVENCREGWEQMAAQVEREVVRLMG